VACEAETEECAPDTVVIVDDDPLVRDSMDCLFRSVGLSALCFSSAEDALRADFPDGPSCVVADIRMPQIGGFEFQEQLHQRGDDLPVIFVTGHGDIPMSVRAMKSGAVDFLSKPFRDQDVLDAVCSALNTARQRLAETRTTNIVRERFATLTARERQVMAGVVRGLLNKQIAYELGLSEITVKLHRSSLMKKMMVRSVPDLVRAEQLVAE